MFTNDDVIFAYTRKQAIEDGVLIDVTATAREAGFRLPVALTASAWGECVTVPEGTSGQDETGRLWDALMMLRFAIAASPGAVGDTLAFRLRVLTRDDASPERVELKAVCGADDDGSPCVTVMLPNED